MSTYTPTPTNDENRTEKSGVDLYTGIYAIQLFCLSKLLACSRQVNRFTDAKKVRYMATVRSFNRCLVSLIVAICFPNL
uniref:G-protein coupled receptors family 1 profile domain-containing protein n=1 Tax=Trichuris muris TaxID=70415 RepID=A0A5S6Q2V4_TRIMR